MRGTFRRQSVHAEVVAALEPTPLTPPEKSVLDLLLSVVYPGVFELREQAEKVVVAGRCDCGCPTFDVAVPDDAPRVSVSPHGSGGASSSPSGRET